MHLIIFSAANFCKCFPTGTLPVNDNLRGIFEAHRRSETSDGTPKTTFSTPGGNPASMKTRAIAIAVTGVYSLGLIVIVQPAASAPPTFLTTFITGKFQATNAITGPIGSFTTVCITPGVLDGTTLP